MIPFTTDPCITKIMLCMSGRLAFFPNVILAGLLGLLSFMATLDKVSGYAVQQKQGRANLIALGRKMFFDPRLSQDGTVSCSSCHQPARAFADGRSTSIGADKRMGTRNTPSLLDVSDSEPLFWDGRRNKLEAAVLDPFSNSVEMADVDMAEVLQKLAKRPDYRSAFQLAFPGDAEPSANHVGEALATFIRSLPRGQTAYDRYRAGKADALTTQARAGLLLFQGKAKCADCHQLAAGRFTDGKFHDSGVGLGNADTHLGQLTTIAVQRNLSMPALGSVVGEDAKLSALGRFLVTHQAVDVGAFRTPSLRDVTLTAPYMHDGSVKTLEAATDIEIYYRGLSTGQPISLTIDERRDLLAFLHSLTVVSPTESK